MTSRWTTFGIWICRITTTWKNAVMEQLRFAGFVFVLQLRLLNQTTQKMRNRPGIQSQSIRIDVFGTLPT